MHPTCTVFMALLFLLSLAPAAAQETNNPYVELKNQYSGKCLAVSRASVAHGARLTHKDCGTSTPDAVWELAATSDGYQIRNKNSGKCLGVEHQSRSDGALVTQVDDCDHRQDTTWRIEALRFGVPLAIRNRNSQKCLALVTGTQIKQYGCGGNPEHVAKTTWQLVAQADPEVKPVTGQTPSELTVLTYNTHLFEDTHVETFSRGANYHEDTVRRHRMRDRIKTYGADIVALQEVWAYDRQSDFIRELRSTYPYAARVDSARKCTLPSGALGLIPGAPPAASLVPTPKVLPLTLGNGLLLLSKWPLSDVKFKRFPVYRMSPLTDAKDDWANKGILTATVLVGDKKIRVANSHILTGDDDIGEMAKNYVAITSFTLKGNPYLLALHRDVGANIFRLDEYGSSSALEDGKKLYGAGKQLVKYGATMSPNYVALTSFQMKGHPYIFGLHRDVGANIWRVNDDGAGLMLLTKRPAKMSPNYVAVVPFQMNGQPYIFGLHRDVGANIWRVNDGGAGLTLLTKRPAKMSPNYVAVVPFQLNGHPHIFGLHRDVGANIWRVNDDGAGLTLLTKRPAKMSPNYVAVVPFRLNGHPHIFGLHRDVGANVWRINDGGAGFTPVKERGPWPPNTKFIVPFEMNGHPYFFTLLNCCGSLRDGCGWERPGEAPIVRIADNGTGWDTCRQMEQIRMIAEEISVSGLPALMMGDFNVDASGYPFMDSIFRRAGARDAYVAVHPDTTDYSHMKSYSEIAEAAATSNNVTNKLAQRFTPRYKTKFTNPERYLWVKRLDYVFAAEQGRDFKLVPIEARVITDWKYEQDMDLSDHYPILTRFRIE